jgi:hypothetical protein
MRVKDRDKDTDARIAGAVGVRGGTTTPPLGINGAIAGRSFRTTTRSKRNSRTRIRIPSA